MKLKSGLLLAVLSAGVFLLSGCGKSVSEERSVNISPQVREMVGTYSVDDISVTNNGKALGISESDLNACKTVEVTEDGMIIFNGLFGDKEFEIAYDQSEDNSIYKIYAQKASAAGYSYVEKNSAQDYIVDNEYEGPTLIDYFYADHELVQELNIDYMKEGCMHVYLKFKGGTDAWYGMLQCSKSN